MPLMFGKVAGSNNPVPIAVDANGVVQSSATLAPGSGDASAANQATQITAEQALLATAGAVAGAAVVTDANGTLQQYLRGLVKLIVDQITVKLAAGTNAIGATKDNGPAWTPVVAMLNSADASTSADFSAAPTGGQKIVIDDLLISVGADMALTFTEETSNTVIFKGYFAANSGLNQVTLRAPRKLPTADKKLRVQASAAGNVFIHLGYHSEA